MGKREEGRISPALSLTGLSRLTCARGDLNPHGCYSTSTSNLRVYRFRHPRVAYSS